MFKVLYNFLITIFYLPYCLIIFLRIFFKKEHQNKYKQKILPQKISRPDGYLFWFHAASIGELNSVFPIIDFFLEKNKNFNFLVTTVTLSSFNEFNRKYGKNNRVLHQFLPYDSNFLVENFFKNWRPNIVSFVDSEIWPNIFFKIKKKNLPFFLLNARITKKTFKRWKIVKRFASEVFESISVSISSNRETVEYLKYFKVRNIKYFGNIKFCSHLNQLSKAEIDEINSNIKSKVWCAVSTHSGEEIFCSQVHKILKKTFNNVITVIIPRHIHRTKKIYLDLKKTGLSVQIKNEKQKIDKSSEIVLVNYYGSVNKYLKSFKQIFIGKSLIEKLKEDGGQNPIDAAKMGCHIFHGPHVSNFQEIYDYLNNEKIAEKIENNPDVLAKKLIENFKFESDRNREKIDKLINYSNEIFINTVKEYQAFIK